MRQHKISLGWLLGLTLAAVVISLPLGPTLSKYVWNENVGRIELTVTPYYHEPDTTYSLQYMTARAVSTYSTWTPGQSDFQVHLAADEGYLLPSTVYVKIDGTRYTVPDGGSSGIWYDAASGYLSIDGDLLWGNPSDITISATAEAIPLLENTVQEWVQQESVQQQPTQQESARQEPVQQQPTQQESARQEPVQQQSTQQEPTQQEPVQQQLTQQEPIQQEPESAQQEPVQQEPAQQGQEPEL